MGKKLEGEKGKKIEREKEWVNVSKLELGFYFSIPSLAFQFHAKIKDLGDKKSMLYTYMKKAHTIHCNMHCCPKLIVSPIPFTGMECVTQELGQAF